MRDTAITSTAADQARTSQSAASTDQSTIGTGTQIRVLVSEKMDLSGREESAITSGSKNETSLASLRSATRPLCTQARRRSCGPRERQHRTDEGQYPRGTSSPY